MIHNMKSVNYKVKLLIIPFQTELLAFGVSKSHYSNKYLFSKRRKNF